MANYVGYDSVNDSLQDSGTTNDFFNGKSGDDYLTSNGGSDNMNGGLGADYLIAYANQYYNPGNSNSQGDTMSGGDGNDTIIAAAEDVNSILGGAGNDDIQVTWYPGDTLQASGAGTQTISGGSGDDTVISFAGLNSTVAGNYITGDGGNDDITVYYGDNTLEGGTGNDDIVSYGDDDSIDGGDGADWISATYGNDTVYGGTGNDYMENVVGGLATLDGNDLMVGGDGADTISGGNGSDTIWAADLGGAQDAQIDKIFFDDAMYPYAGGDGDTDYLGLVFTSGAALDKLYGAVSGQDAIIVYYDDAVYTNAALRLVNVTMDFDGDGNTESVQRAQFSADLVGGGSLGWSGFLNLDPFDSTTLSTSDFALVAI